MARYRIRNNTSSNIVIPSPVGKLLAKHSEVYVTLPAAEMDSPALYSLVKSGKLTITPMNDANAPDSLEVIPSASVGGRRVVWREEFFTPGAEVILYCDPVNGDDNGDGSPRSPFQTIQVAIDSVPDGFLARVTIQLLPGRVVDTGIVFTPMPGAGVSLEHFEGGARIQVKGAREVVATVTPVTGTAQAAVSSGGVVKAAQRTLAVSPWSTPIQTGEHFVDRISPPFPEPSRFPCVSDFSDHESGVLCLVSPTVNWGTSPIEVYTLASYVSSDNGSTFYISANSHYECSVINIRFTNTPVDLRGASLSGCSGDSLAASSRPTTNQRSQSLVTGCVFSGPSKRSFYNCVRAAVSNCYFSGATVNFFFGSVETLFNTVVRHNGGNKLHLGGRSGGSPYKAGVVSIDRLIGLDIEGSSSGIVMYGGVVDQQGDVTFEGGSNPLIVRYGGHWIRTGGLLTGEGTGPVQIETGSQIHGASAAHTYTNTSNADHQIKVGGNAPIKFSDIGTGKTDLALGDDSQLCRAS